MKGQMTNNEQRRLRGDERNGYYQNIISANVSYFAG